MDNKRYGTPTNNSGSGKPMSRQPGKPGLNHAQRRMNAFNRKKAEETGVWSEPVFVEERAEEIADARMVKASNKDYAQRRINAQAQRRQGQQNKPVNTQGKADSMRGTVNTPPQDELMWDEGAYGGTVPVIQQYSQNFDFSTYPDVISAAYREYEALNPRIKREMPECIFAHACNEVLQVKLIEQVKEENADVEFAEECNPVDIMPKDMEIPALLGEYLQTIAQAVTPTGDKVYVNLPTAVRPKKSGNGLEAGHFGPCTAENHNKYEVAMSPLVTKAVIDRTAEANRAPNAAGAFDDWQPLPAALVPQDSVATPNLLGYRIPERLQPEGISKCENLTFANGNTIAGRIRDCPEITIRVADYIKNNNHKIKTVPLFPVSKPSNATAGIVKTSEDVPNTVKLTHYPVRIESPIALGASASNKSGTYGLKRRRTDKAPGFCLVTDEGESLPGWGNTINSNLNMEGDFAPLIGIDRPSWREVLHITASPGGSRLIHLYEQAKRYAIR